MASCRANWFERYVLYKTPFLYKRRDCGNFHFFMDKHCFCRCGEHSENWNGGISTISIIGTITNLLCGDILSFVLDKNKIIKGVKWFINADDCDKESFERVEEKL